MIQAHIIIGIAVVILNLIPFIFRKTYYLPLTGAVSLFMLLLLIFIGE